MGPETSHTVNLATLGKFADVVNTGNFDLFKEAVAPGCVDHDPAPGQASGPDGYRMFFSQMRTAFPDLSVAPEALVADDESIAFAYTDRHTSGTAWRDHTYGKEGKNQGDAIFQIQRWQDGRALGKLG
jgi:predicted ester cyclase